MSGFFGKDREMEIWAEKYRPETLEDYVGNDHIKDKVKRYIEDDDIPHLLFHSKKPGTGKCLGQSEMVDVKIRAFDKNERELRLPVGRLFELLGVDNNKYEEFQKVDWDVSIKDPSGEYVCINSFVKKKGDVFSYQFRDGTSITCDENHLVKNWKAGEFQRICNVQFVKTATGKKEIVDKEFEGYKDVYDFSLNDPHEYVTSSGIVCHNTSLAKIIVNNINCQYMYINASDENSVDTMRNKIKQYASNVAINNLNVIILDESDMLSPQSQAALRRIMEDFAQTTRFILACNFVSKIVEPVVSRTQSFKVLPPKKSEVAKKLVGILQNEGIEFEKSQVGLIVNQYYPDIRKVFNNAQQNTIDGELVVHEEDMVESSYKFKLLELLKDNSKNQNDLFQEIRELTASAPIDSYSDVYRFLFDKADEYAEGHVAEVYLQLAESLFEDSMTTDPEITFSACIIQIIDIIR